jgi:hypothetical protein
MALLVMCLPTEGCMGWGDVFAPKHVASGDYSLMHGEPDSDNDVYLMVKGKSVSVAGPLHQIGWNQQYVIFTDANWPNPWSVIRVKDHSKFTVTEAQRLTDPAFKGITILSPQDAWNTKTH